MRRTAAQTRSHVLEVAGDLFYNKGIRATGIDLVAAKAGVAPTTLYRQFASKEDLVGAYVQRADHDLREAMAAAVQAAGPDPRDQILAVFDFTHQQIKSRRFRGCAMMMTLAEFPDPDQPAHRNAVEGKSWFRTFMAELTNQLGVDNPAELADHLTLVVEGMLASGQALGPDGPAKQAPRLAEMILSSVTARSTRS